MSEALGNHDLAVRSSNSLPEVQEEAVNVGANQCLGNIFKAGLGLRMGQNGLARLGNKSWAPEIRRLDENQAAQQMAVEQMLGNANEMGLDHRKMESAEAGVFGEVFRGHVQAAAMSGVTASKEDEEARKRFYQPRALEEAVAQEMEREMDNTTWSIDVLPQPQPSDVELQDAPKK